MTSHPAELSLQDITNLDRDGLFEALDEYCRHCSFRLTHDRLETLSVTELRRLLMRVRRHYQAKGY